MARGILIGALGIIFVTIVTVSLLAMIGLLPVNADTRPGKLETWIAKKVLHASVKRQAQPQSNPLSFNASNLVAGIKLYADNCLVCHGASDGKTSNIAQGLYQKAPQLAKHGVEDDPEGRTYWVIAHGIRLTGMPAFSATLDKNQLWQLSMFLKHMHLLPPQADKVWKALASAEVS